MRSPAGWASRRPPFTPTFPARWRSTTRCIAWASGSSSEAEEELWRTTAPDWERIHAWFALRLALAEEHPDLYHLVFDVPIPGFVLTPESLEEVRRLYEVTVRSIAEVIEAGAMRPNLSPEQATHLLISMRLGLVAAHVGKHRR